MHELLSPNDARELVETVASVGVCISSLEWLVNARSLAEGRLFSWSVLSLRFPILLTGWHGRLFAPVFSYYGVLTLLGLRLSCAALLLILPHSAHLRGTTVLMLAVTGLVFRLRVPIGADGSDQLSSIIFVALSFGYLGGTEWSTMLALAFLAAQAALAYFTAGILKLVTLGWRNGTYLSRVWSTNTYGSTWLGSLLRRLPGLAVCLSWSVIVLEVAFPLVFVLPVRVVWSLLLLGLAFHFATAVTMGLNTFLWSFVATYPAVIWFAGLPRP